jgi:manganese/iron transport system ATP-binding protein
MGLVNELRRTGFSIRRHHPPHQADTPILEVVDLTMRYEAGIALDAVTFELCVGERVAVVGPNGAGKSTLFKIIAGVLHPSDGTVDVYGHSPHGHICIAYVPQRSQVNWDFPVNVTDVVMMGRVGKMGLFRHPSSRDREIVRDALNTVNLSHLSQRQIRELSGGQQQRMFIARALAQEAELVLMDEPLTGLDATSQHTIFEILEQLQRRRVTVMVALHDLKMAAEHFDRVMLLNVRQIGFGSPLEALSSENLLEAYGGHLQLLPAENGWLAVSDTCCDDGESHNGH